MTGGTPICGSETEMTLLHFVVFEEKIGLKVIFLTHKQARKTKAAFSYFASID